MAVTFADCNGFRLLTGILAVRCFIHACPDKSRANKSRAKGFFSFIDTDKRTL